MSKFIMEVQSIGPLYLLHSFLEHDGYPLLFVCEDLYESLYLFDETADEPEFEEWVALKITRQMYHDILADRVSFRKAYNKSIGMKYYLIRHFFSDDSITCKEVDDVPEHFLPKEGLYNGMLNPTNSGRLINQDIKSESKIVTIEVYPENPVTGIDLKLHYDLCDAYVGMLENTYGSSYITPRIVLNTAASFCIRMEIISKDKVAVPVDSAIEKVSGFITSADDTLFYGCKNEKKAKECTQRFLEAVASTGHDVVVSRSTLNGLRLVSDIVRCKESSYMAKKLKESIDSSKEELTSTIAAEIDIYGALIGYDLNAKKFVISHSETVTTKKNKTKEVVSLFKGKLAKDFKNSQSVGINCYYNAHLRRFMDGKYELVSLKKQASASKNDSTLYV